MFLTLDRNHWLTEWNGIHWHYQTCKVTLVESHDKMQCHF